jgi:uncharacterized protein YllA (UPF0747 family)
VATGQQVGLFSGPAYTIYKALHAARLAEWLTAQGLPAVPVFWLATEDHDFAEVNHTWVFNAQHRPVKLEMRRQTGAQPVGGVELAAPPATSCARRWLSCRSRTRWPTGCRNLRDGRTMGQAFGDLLRRLLARFDIPQVDPMLPAFRELAAPSAAQRGGKGSRVDAAVLDRNRELVEARLPRTGPRRAADAFFFLLENGKRLALRRQTASTISTAAASRHRGACRSRGRAFAQRLAEAGGAGLHPAHRGQHHRPR